MKNKNKIRIKNSIAAVFKTKPRISAFTLLELLVGLIISSIVLTAIVTLSYAMSSAYQTTNEINEKEAQVRYTTIQISDLIKNSRLICRSSSYELAIWKEDKNGDNLINISELVYIETGEGNYIRLLEFNPSNSDDKYELSYIKRFYAKQWFVYKYPETYTTLIDGCTNAYIDNPAGTQKVIISFDIEENQENHKCQIISNLRCPMSNFINSEGNLISDDDDF